MVEPQSMSEALRTEIVRLVTEGDVKVKGALTSEVLLRVMRVTKTGRDLLMSLEASPSNLANLIQRPNQNQMYMPSYSSGLAVPSVDPGEELGSLFGATPFAPSPTVENFGMTAIRELISAAKSFNGNKGDDSPVKLVEALVLAREKGLDDVAKELEARLGMKKPEVKVVEPVVAIEEKR